MMRQAAGSALGSRCETHSRSLISSSSLSSIFSLSQSSMAKSSHTWYLPSPCSAHTSESTFHRKHRASFWVWALQMQLRIREPL